MNIILVKQSEVADGYFSFQKNDERFLHIKKVLRLGVGELFKAGIVNGAKGTARLTAFDDECLTARFLTLQDSADDETYAPLPPINLILGFPRPIQLRRILRDVAGLGIEALYLIGTELGEKSYRNAALADEGAIEKLLIDGLSQAGQTHIPQVHRSESLRGFFARHGGKMGQGDIKAVLDVPTKGGCDKQKSCHAPHGVSTACPACGLSQLPLSHLSWDGKTPLWLAIGSERGWSFNERVLFTEHAFFSYTMGKRILRTETAVTAALAVCLALSRLWEKGMVAT